MTDWRPDKLARRMPFLQARARIQAALRQWFAAEGFVEVETPILQVAPGAEVHLQGFATDWETPDGEEEQVRWLHSSPEFAMKKLLAGGVPKLFQFARVFRNGEGSALHHPEFTMLEWYRAGAGYETIMGDCAALLGLTGARELSCHCRSPSTLRHPRSSPPSSKAAIIACRRRPRLHGSSRPSRNWRQPQWRAALRDRSGSAASPRARP